MTEQHLRKLLNGRLEFLSRDNQFKRMYEPEYHTFKFDESDLSENSHLLVFDYKSFGFEFKSFEISCMGIEIMLKSDRYYRISVQVNYDLYRQCLFNYVLIVPHYTAADMKGKSRICQASRKIYHDKGLQRYIKSLHARFECPVQPE